MRSEPFDRKVFNLFKKGLAPSDIDRMLKLEPGEAKAAVMRMWHRMRWN